MSAPRRGERHLAPLLVVAEGIEVIGSNRTEQFKVTGGCKGGVAVEITE